MAQNAEPGWHVLFEVLAKSVASPISPMSGSMAGHFTSTWYVLDYLIV